MGSREERERGREGERERIINSELRIPNSELFSIGSGASV
jgi:hypothetical protein